MLHVHKLARLAERCGVLCNIAFTRLETALFRELTDYYLDTNYPGIDYVELSEAQATQVHEETLQFQAQYESRLCRTE